MIANFVGSYHEYIMNSFFFFIRLSLLNAASSHFSGQPCQSCCISGMLVGICCLRPWFHLCSQAPCPAPTCSPLCGWKSGEGRQMGWEGCHTKHVQFIQFVWSYSPSPTLPFSIYHISISLLLLPLYPSLTPLSFLPSFLPLGAGHWDANAVQDAFLETHTGGGGQDVWSPTDCVPWRVPKKNCQCTQ